MMVSKIAVVGAGLMGHGIALEFALAGFKVKVHDLGITQLQRAQENIRSTLTMLHQVGMIEEKQKENVLANIEYSMTLEEVVKTADIVFEAIFEDLPLKQSLFKRLDEQCYAHTILASNTSTFLPSQLAVATHRPDKVLVTHYFNPPYLLPLVEIVQSEKTSKETVDAVYNLLSRMGKIPVLVKKEVLGFIVNRLQVALLREALSIVEQGIATPQDVDNAIKNSFGRRLAVAGIFEVFEFAGWDLVLAVCSHLFPAIESSSDIPLILREKVDSGELGIKTGKGFYEWTPETTELLRRKIGQALIKMNTF